MTKARTLADNYAADINQVTADAPLTGGGTSGTVTVGIQAGTTAQSGAVQLTDSTASTSTTTAATPNSVKSAYDLANTANTAASSAQTTANAAIAKSTIDAKGDLLVGSANDTVSRLAVASTAGYVLTVDSAEATGLKWAAAPAASGPAFSATRTSNQSISASTSTKIQVNVETFDTDACYDPTTNYRFTPNKAGYYLIQGWLRITHSSGGSYTQLALHKNGNYEFYYFIEPDQLNGGSWGGDYLMYFNGTTDYVELYAYSAGTDPNVAGVVFSGTWIRS